MTPHRAAELLANEQPDPNAGFCTSCHTPAPALYREPLHLFDNEAPDAVCAPCARRIAGSHRAAIVPRDQIGLDL